MDVRDDRNLWPSPRLRRPCRNERVFRIAATPRTRGPNGDGGAETRCAETGNRGRSFSASLRRHSGNDVGCGRRARGLGDVVPCEPCEYYEQLESSRADWRAAAAYCTWVARVLFARAPIGIDRSRTCVATGMTDRRR